jgi:hypothetical protein
MGNDGGSIPTRRELVKSAARVPTVSELKATALESLSHAWTHDALTSESLDMENVVSDWRGRLYNYETILKGLMPSSGSEENVPALDTADLSSFSSTGIRSLRDVVKLKFKRYSPPGSKKHIWACPVTLKELGPATKAVYLVPCGHVLAEAAMTTISAEGLCPECSEAFEAKNVVVILPTSKEELDTLAKRMEELAADGLTHSLKKDKSAGSKKKRKATSHAEDVEGNGKAKDKSKDGSEKDKSVKADARVSGINNALTASLTAKVMAEQEDRNKRRKLAAAR